eukprot:109370-Rhodomonas_salina.1
MLLPGASTQVRHRVHLPQPPRVQGQINLLRLRAPYNLYRARAVSRLIPPLPLAAPSPRAIATFSMLLGSGTRCPAVTGAIIADFKEHGKNV